MNPPQTTATRMSERLKAEGITKLYHITHKDNIASIKQLGLLSLAACEEQNVGPNFLSLLDSREKDFIAGLQDYVRCSYSPTYPLGNVDDRALVEVDISVVDAPETRFFNCNALYKDAVLRATPEGTNFNLFSSGKKFLEVYKDKEAKKRFMAEVLIPRHIPLKYLTFSPTPAKTSATITPTKHSETDRITEPRSKTPKGNTNLKRTADPVNVSGSNASQHDYIAQDNNNHDDELAVDHFAGEVIAHFKKVHGLSGKWKRLLHQALDCEVPANIIEDFLGEASQLRHDGKRLCQRLI